VEPPWCARRRWLPEYRSANGLDCHIILISFRPCSCFLPLGVRQLLAGQLGGANARYPSQRSVMPVQQSGSGPLINRVTDPLRIGSAVPLAVRRLAQPWK
jgi:hypothetical protein